MQILIGEAYKAMKLSRGGDRKSEKFSSLQNEDLKKRRVRTCDKVAGSLGVSRSTVERAEHFLDGLNAAENRKRPGSNPRRFLLFRRNMFDQIAGLTTKHGTNPVDVVPTHQLAVSQLLDCAFSQQLFFAKSVRVVSLLFESRQNIDLVSDWHPITSS